VKFFILSNFNQHDKAQLLAKSFKKTVQRVQSNLKVFKIGKCEKWNTKEQWRSSAWEGERMPVAKLN